MHLLGFLSIWIGGSFLLATGLGWSFFMLGATYGHLYQTLREGNYAPYNFLTIFSDGSIAVWMIVLLCLYWRWVGFQQQEQVSGQQRLTRKESGQRHFVHLGDPAAGPLTPRFLQTVAPERTGGPSKRHQLAVMSFPGGHRPFFQP